MLVFWGDQAKREQIVPTQPNIKIKATCFIYNLNESFPWLLWLPSGATARGPEVVMSDITTLCTMFIFVYIVGEAHWGGDKFDCSGHHVLR